MDRSNDPEADGVFSNAPIFNFNDGKVKFNTNPVDNANDQYGTSSGFLPKSLFTAKRPVTWRFAYFRFSVTLSTLRASDRSRLFVAG